jgi:hypothetical protein
MGEIGAHLARLGALERRVKFWRRELERRTVVPISFQNDREDEMMGRSIVTATMALLALGALFDDPMGIGYPTGALLVVCAALTWFYWPTISEGFRSAKDESNVPIIRMGAKIIGGMEILLHGSPGRRSSSASGS